ncbi:MAG: patatin-like phospholipase family protein [Gammaproteobacteria bacterium]
MFDFYRGRLTLICGLVVTVDAFAQPPEVAPDRDSADPVIGLVLSGGGARGGAHVGVLRALEELGVSIDVIAGTSIGAIIGGFYASGLSVDEIEEIVNTIDWDSAFLEDMPRQLRSFRRKRDDDLFLVDQKPGLNNGEFELPLGVVQGQVIDLILTEQTLHVAQVDDFDELPIPFRAVAADIATGDTVILESGNLATALRASMSVPAVIAPIDIDGRLLVDGGVVMNLPVQVAEEMGADVVIAVDISAPMLSREELTSVLSITGQLTNILTRRGTVEQIERLGDDDVLIAPEFGDEFSSAGFNRMGETVTLGYDAVMTHAAELGAFASAAPMTGPSTVRADLPVIDFVRLQNSSGVSDALLERHLRGIELGQPLDVDAVEEAIGRIYGSQIYQNVRYSVVSDGDRNGLELQLDERAWGPNYLQLGLDFSASGDENVTFGLSTSYLRQRINSMNGDWRATATLGDEPALLADWYQPFGRDGQYFFAPAFRMESDVVNVFEGGDRIAELQIREASVEIAGGRNFGTWGELRAGVRRTSGNVKLELGDPAAVPNDDFEEGELFARFSVDTLDNLPFPRDGAIGHIEWRGSRPSDLGAQADFDQVSLAAAYAKTWNRYTLLTRFRYDATVDGVAPVSSLARLGGFLDLSGYNRNELTGQNAARVGAVFYRQVNNLTILPAYAGVSLEYGNVWENRHDISSRDSLLGGSIWVGVDTPVGPVYAGYGRSEDDVGAFYVFLGRIF